jgi:SNF2 family DNA or RNA helicase
MIWLKKYKKGFVSLFFRSAKGFKSILEVMRSYVGNYYNAEESTWIVPKIHAGSVLDSLSVLDEPIVCDTEAKRSIDRGTRRIEHLLALKEKHEGINFPISMVDGKHLFPFQEVGAEFLYRTRRCLLADVVGLGKTLQALAVCERCLDERKVNLCIIVCPKTLARKWQKDLETFFNQSSRIVDGVAQGRIALYNRINKLTYLILGYETMRSDYNYIMDCIQTRHRSFILVFDEVQYLKNTGALRSQAAYELANMPELYSVLGLTATYIENGLENIYGIFKVIKQDLFGNSPKRFFDNYCECDWFGRVIGYKNVDDLVEKIGPYNIRRQKEEIFEQLPTVSYIDYEIELPKEQRIIYEAVKEQLVDAIEDWDKKTKVERANALTLSIFLQQATLSAEVYDEDIHESGKLRELINILEGMDTKSKVVVFCHFTKIVEIIARDLDEAGYPNYWMHGKSAPDTYIRQSIVDEWSTNKEKRILITSDILAEGIDLVAASYLINFDMLWNPAKMMQRNGRIDRLSQKAKAITIINLIAKDTIDEKILARTREKEELMKTVMDGGFVSGRIDKVTISELKEMLK